MKGELQAVVDAFAQSIIKSVMDERKMGAEDFFKSARTEHIKARRAAIRKLTAAGFGVTAAARAMKVPTGTIYYSISPSFRNRKLAGNKARHQAIAAARDGRITAGAQA